MLQGRFLWGEKRQVASLNESWYLRRNFGRRMKQIVSFTKASGAGNDFVVIENWDESLQVDQPRLAVTLCSRHYGVGADGLIVLEPAADVHFTMKYYNADGSYGGMCGNGGRCAARLAFLKSLAPATMKFRSLGQVYEAEIVGEEVRLNMTEIKKLRPVSVKINQEIVSGVFLDSGSPHFVIAVEDADAVNVDEFGRALRNHSEFFPNGTNVDFVQQTPGGIRIRTYERGVECETLACGTGVVASAIVCSSRFSWNSPVTLYVRSGEKLSVSFDQSGSTYTNVWLQGSAHILFTGTVLYDEVSGSIMALRGPEKLPQSEGPR